MDHPILARPTAGEFDSYYSGYIAKAPEGDMIAHLTQQMAEAARLLGDLSDEVGLRRYAPGKWSVKEVLGHLIDTERVMAYRMLRIARGDATPLPGFDQDTFVPAGAFDRRAMEDLIEEYASVREATIRLLGGLDGASLERRGVANGCPVSARAIAFIIAGHELHHLGVLRDRYGLS